MVWTATTVECFFEATANALLETKRVRRRRRTTEHLMLQTTARPRNGTEALSLCCGNGGFSSAFSENDATWRTSSSSALDDDAEEDVYEMALEVLEGDEAYRLESSGSISPESDVDRLLENADAERFPGDVTLVRVFSIQREVEGGNRSGSGNRAGVDHDGGGLMSMENESDHDFRRLSCLDDRNLTDERLLPDLELYTGETESEASAGKIRSPSAVARRIQQAFDSADLQSVDLNSNSSSTVGLAEGLTKPRRTSTSQGNPDSYFADSGLVFGAKFSNVKSKDALIKTSSLTVTSFSCMEQNNDQKASRPESEDVSLHMTSSDSLYSTDECFCHSSFPDATIEPHFAAGKHPFSGANFGHREPSPEELFDLALETRSDLAGSSVGSSSFYDAVQCSPSACIHRDPSPEEAFDLALETLSDVIDDDSSSVFIITPRPKRNDLRPDLPSQTIKCSRTAYEVESARRKMTDAVVNGADCCPLCGRRRCYPDGGRRGLCCGERSSSCEAIIDDDQLMRTIGGSSYVDLLTDSSDWEASCCRRLPQQSRHRFQQGENELRWSSDPCPSSPEPSTLADYSTDDCVGGDSEEDSSMTDCDGLDQSSSLRNNFFLQRLLRRRQTDFPMPNGWTGKEPTKEDRLLDQVQICSIEDLLTDSDLERDSWNLKAQATTDLELQLHDNSPIISFFRSNGIRGRLEQAANDLSVEMVGPIAQVVGPIQPLSPPIAQSTRTDVHYARKSRIPKLPESRTTLSPVRVSW